MRLFFWLASADQAASQRLSLTSWKAVSGGQMLDVNFPIAWSHYKDQRNHRCSLVTPKPYFIMLHVLEHVSLTRAHSLYLWQGDFKFCSFLIRGFCCARCHARLWEVMCMIRVGLAWCLVWIGATHPFFHCGHTSHLLPLWWRHLSGDPPCGQLV